MADIDVVKKRTSMWPWIIGIIVLALIVWWVLAALSGPGGADTAAPVSQLYDRAVAAMLALA